MRKLLFGTLFVAGLCALCVPAAQAKAYVGAAAGQGNATVDGPGESFNGSDTGYKLLGGYRVMKFFSVEADYRDFGGLSDNIAGEEITIDTTALDLFAVGVVPIGTSFEVFGKAGYAMWDAKFSSSLSPGSYSDDGNDLAYGIGAAYNFSKVGVRLEYELFDIEDTDDVSMASVGAVFRF
jgi:hypothetical protein